MIRTRLSRTMTFTLPLRNLEGSYPLLASKATKATRWIYTNMKNWVSLYALDQESQSVDTVRTFCMKKNVVVVNYMTITIHR